MRLPFPKAAATAVLVAAFALAAPAAASAETYPPSGSTSDDINVSSLTVTAGGTVTITFDAGTFVPGEPVTLSVTGESAFGVTLAQVVKTAIETRVLGTVAASGDGSAPAFTVRMPANASGNYVFTATSPSVPGGISVTVAVVAAGVGADGSSGDLIATTGTDSAMLLGLWVGGGALLLAGGAVVVATTVRRQRQNANS